MTVTATGDFGSSNSRTFDISVANFNTPSSLDAGPDQTVHEGSTVTLNGTATDQDTGDILTYLWSHNSTLPITIADPNAADTTFIAPNVATDTPIAFTLAVSDGTATNADQVTVTIADSANSPPTVSAGPDQTVQEGSTVTLNGTAADTDPEDTPTYLWSHNSTLPITIADPNAADTTFIAPNVATDTPIAFTLAVSDGTATNADQVTVTIADSANSPPTVSAGPDQTVQEGSTVTLNGTAADTGPEDTPTYLWSHNSTLPITIADPNAADTTFIAPNVATDTPIAFTLAVSDGTATASDTLLVTITDNDGGETDTGNTASVADVTSATPDGTYDIGDMIDVRISFTESVWLERYAIEDDRRDATGSGTFGTLDYPMSVTTIEIGGAIYALVAANADDGVQIIDITDPANPAAVSSVTDGAGGFDMLDGASSVDTITIGGSHYALVAADTDDGVQIIDITDPANPAAVSSVTDGAGGFDMLDGASSVDTITIGGSHYALVAANADDGVQIIDITDPANPAAVSSVTDGAGGFDMLDGARRSTPSPSGAATTRWSRPIQTTASR